MLQSELYSELKDVASIVRRIQFTFRGKPISVSSESIRVAFTLQGILLLDLFPGYSEYQRYKRWISGVENLDLYNFGIFQKNLIRLMRNVVNMSHPNQVCSLSEFKRQIGSPTFWGFVAPVYADIESIIECADTCSYRRAVQYLDFLSKLRVRDAVFDSERDFVSFESGIRPFPSDVNQRVARNVIKEWFRSISFDDFVPRHGPHSVREFDGRSVGLIRKYRSFRTDNHLNFLLRRLSGQWSDFSPYEVPDGLVREAKQIFVPKTIVSDRGISKEPAILQYFQQGVSRVIRNYISQHSYLSRRIHLTNQIYSQRLAQEGSIDGSYSTIDLSAASDSVTLEMVKYLFGGVPELLYFLVLTRSTWTELSDRSIRLRKYAPMGNGTTFDVETIIFASIVELSVRACHCDRRPYYVYGDDIVLPTQAYDYCCSLLEEFGFTVNRSKSFSGWTVSNFREACGGEYLNGADVTPARIPRFWQFEHEDSTELTWFRQVGLINRLFDFRLMQTRRALLKLCQQSKRYRKDIKFSVFSDDGTRGIQTYADSYTNFQLKWRYVRATQTYQYLCLIPHASPYGVRDDDVAYFEWLRQSAYGRSDRSHCDMIDLALDMDKYHLSMSDQVRSYRVTTRHRWVER